MQFKRFALYYLPPAEAPWAQAATAWLGWDALTGQEVAHPVVDTPVPIDQITATPRKYGLHATIKPPFALTPGTSPEALQEACATLCAGLAPVTLPGLSLARLGRFLALRPVGSEVALNALAAACVEGLDDFRAPPSAAELAKRRKSGLSAAQDQMLQRWGYPHVMDLFRFHITLSGRLDPAQAEGVQAALSGYLTPLLPAPVTISDMALAGEAEDGRFHLIQRYALSGARAGGDIGGKTDSTA